jgi:hypothetical protein
VSPRAPIALAAWLAGVQGGQRYLAAQPAPDPDDPDADDFETALDPAA